MVEKFFDALLIFSTFIMRSFLPAFFIYLYLVYPQGYEFSENLTLATYKTFLVAARTFLPWSILLACMAHFYSELPRWLSMLYPTLLAAVFIYNPVMELAAFIPIIPGICLLGIALRTRGGFSKPMLLDTTLLLAIAFLFVYDPESYLDWVYE